MISDTEIFQIRKNRDEQINTYLDLKGLDRKTLEFHDINPRWRFKVEIALNRDKKYSDDYKVQHKRVGSVKFHIEGQKFKLNLYQNLADNKYYTYTKDLSTNKGTYKMGRFSRVFKLGEDYYLDFNASFSPACAHLGEVGVSCPYSQDNEIPFDIQAGEKYFGDM